MIESLVITLREGIEAALVIGIILAYLRKANKTSLSRFVYAGLTLAIIGSLVFATAFQMLGIDPENEVMEGTMLGVAGIFVATMVIWMWRTARNVKTQVESRLAAIVQEEPTSSFALGPGLGLAAFTFFMVLREGIETVLFLAAATVGEFDFLAALGGAVGIGLAVLFAIFFIRGSLRVNLSRFFAVTGVVLLLLAAKLIAGSIHEFAEVDMIPMSKDVMAILGYFVRDASSTVILMALLALPMLLLLWDTGKTEEPRNASSATNPAERRKLLASKQRDLTWRVALTLATLVVISAMGTTVFAGSKIVDPVPEAVTATGGQIRIPLAELTEGQLAKFAYQTKDGATIRFLVASEAGEKPMTALDACQICGSAGYMQEEGHAVCKNCNAPIAIGTLGYGGGCNPIALDSHVDGSHLVIAVSSLDEAQHHFMK